MTEFILELDRSLFVLINQGMTSDLLDTIMPIMRDKLVWIPVYVFMLSFLFFNLPGRQAGIALLMIALTMTASDTASSKVIKPQVERLRPCNDKAMRPMLTLRARCGGGYSFTSSHATNHFALSTILFLLIGAGFWRWGFFLWAGMIALAQVYVGVHYPVDITAGAILGMLIAGLVYLVLGPYWRLLRKPKIDVVQEQD